jgi:hypothetical protein
VGDDTIDGAGLLELAHDRHELVGLLRRLHAVGSSNTSTFASRLRRLDDLDPLLHADRQVVDQRQSGSTSKPKRAEISRTFARAGVEVEHAGEAGLLVPEDDVLGDREDGDEHEVLCTMPMRRPSHRPGPAKVLHLVVEQDLAVVGLVQAVAARS